MDIASIFDSIVGVQFFQNSAQWNAGMILIPLLLVFGIRFLVFSPLPRSWVSLPHRLLLGAFPAAVGIFLLVAAVSELVSETGRTITGANATSILLGLIIGACLAFAAGRYLEPSLDRFIERRSSPAANRDGKTDIRDLSFPEADSVDLPAEFSKAMANDEMFLGVNVSGAPIVIARTVWKSSHVQIMGPPGTGKGVQACASLHQSLKYGDAVYAFDPKEDEWAASVLHDACHKSNVPFRYVNLKDHAPQINPLRGASVDEVTEMFYAGFQLTRKGAPSDFYRQDDREAARQTARILEQEPMSLAELRTAASGRLDPAVIGAARNFFGALGEIAQLPCVQTLEGVDLAAPLEEGGCVYIVGSMRNESILILQKLLLLRVVQLVEARTAARHCTIFLDEFKYMLSAPALNALGTIRDKRCNILLAHQSLGDFGDCGSDMSESSVSATILDSTPIKWLYRPTNHSTAEWISNQTGRIRIDVEQRRAYRNPELAELVSHELTLAESERNLIDVNTVLRLPNRCAVYVGPEVSEIASATPVAVEKRSFAPMMADRAAPAAVDLTARAETDENAHAREIIGASIKADWRAELQVLALVYDEMWTHQRVVESLFPESSRQKVAGMLKRLESRRLIRALSIDHPCRKVWAITKAGQAAVMAESSPLHERPEFRKYMVNVIMVDHHVELQLQRVRALRAGWPGWSLGDRGRGQDANRKYPDALAVRQDGAVVAIELERTIKTEKRYRQIMLMHIDGYRKRHWDRTYYISPTEDHANRLRRLYDGIKHLEIGGESVSVPDECRALFSFYSYQDNWEQAAEVPRN